MCNRHDNEKYCNNLYKCIDNVYNNLELEDRNTTVLTTTMNLKSQDIQ